MSTVIGSIAEAMGSMIFHSLLFAVTQSAPNLTK